MEMPHLVYVYCRTHRGRQQFLFFPPSPLFSFYPIPPRYVSTFPPTCRLYRLKLSGQVQTAGGKRNTFSFACFYIIHVQIHISFFKQMED